MLAVYTHFCIIIIIIHILQANLIYLTCD